ncbi:MAG: hypothetical protein ABH950_09155, partial [Candidatus Altiarchaeota archaeon]
MMDNLTETLKQYWLLVYRRQWENWELLTISAVATGLLLLLIAIRRRKETHGKRENVRMTAGRSEITDHQRIKFFQQEIIKRDYTEARLEREVSELTADNEELRGKITELTST